MIEAHGVSKMYSRGVYALRDLSISIGKADFVFLTGPSGAGKSTFLRLCLRESVPSEGVLKIGGRDLAKLSPWQVQAYRRSIGFVFQDFKLIPWKTVLENIAIVPRVLGAPSSTQQRRTFQVLKWVGLQHRINAFPMELSGGEQQRIAIARALVNDPHLILADEPTGNLDPDLSLDIMFPSELATGICSLNPRVDRLVQSCLMEIDRNGSVVRCEFHDGVINTAARMTYTEVNALLTDRPAELIVKYRELVPRFEMMGELFQILNARRKRRGSIDFDLPEAEVLLDEAGRVEAIVEAERNIAHKLIEEFMPPPPGGIGASFFSSGMSHTSASVVSSSDAIDDAFCSAERTTLVGSMTPAAIKSSSLSSCAL